MVGRLFGTENLKKNFRKNFRGLNNKSSSSYGLYFDKNKTPDEIILLITVSNNSLIVLKYIFKNVTTNGILNISYKSKGATK